MRRALWVDDAAPKSCYRNLSVSGIDAVMCMPKREEGRRLKNVLCPEVMD